PIDMIVELRSQHEKGNKYAGLDVFQGKAVDMLKAGVVEPVRVKTQAISSATESAVMILRIDDVIAAKSMSKNGGKGGPPGGMPGGMGGMGGMGGEF
ncbi:MAG: thermosome subunit, partial [Euryarchaeota archaeon]|nr:thermosome subunit [Euryarchaeota archaeon]